MSASDTMKSMGLTSPGAEREKLNKLLKIFDDKGINLEDSKVGQMTQINRYILLKMFKNMTMISFYLHFTDVFMNLKIVLIILFKGKLSPSYVQVHV